MILVLGLWNHEYWQIEMKWNDCFSYFKFMNMLDTIAKQLLHTQLKNKARTENTKTKRELSQSGKADKAYTGIVTSYRI